MMVKMKKDVKKVDNWLYLIKKRAQKESVKKGDTNQEMHCT